MNNRPTRGSWTYGRKIGAGFAAVVAMSLALAAISIYALRSAVDSKDRVITVDAQTLLDAQTLHYHAERETSATRGYALSAAPRFLETLADARGDVAATLAALAPRLDNAAAVQLLAEVRQANGRYDAVLDRLIDARRGSASADALDGIFTQEVLPLRDALRDALDALFAHQQHRMAVHQRAASDRAATMSTLVLGVALVALLLAIALAIVLTRALTTQIGSAVQHIQSSSNELQTAANQQASGAKEQATAMTEITTTISELLATSRQIAESAQRVASVATDTASSASAGERRVRLSSDSMASIKRQVDTIVLHMLELGKKSQQIGGVLELINELADQTNILAINATIEAAGAGDAGRRFAVVADEIRKLADRVAGSTKEIRGLIDEIRAAVNTTVMATEGGSKAVDAGALQFAAVTEALAAISELVGTTTEAAREIELSTKQQSTAVEQVNIAVANVAQATRETETSTSQTLQTASQLTTLSSELLRLVQPQAGPRG